MYAGPGLIYPSLQSYNQTEFFYDAPQTGNFIQNYNFDFDLGAEGDLFKAPQPIIEEPFLSLDPLTAAMTNISNGQDVMTETIKAANMESMQNEQLNDVLYDCKKELLAKYAIDEMLNVVPNVELHVNETQEVPVLGNINSNLQGLLHRSVSTGCLSSMDWVGNNCSGRPNFLDFQCVDFETAFGLRRAFSEGDIQALEYRQANKGSTVSLHGSFDTQLTVSDMKSEERLQQLMRYRNKKNKRNFGRKIKYACRKALADSQPRVRGRFAKTEDREISKQSKMK